MKEIKNKEFFQVDTISLAEKLIGKWIVTRIDGKERKAQIYETEAYLGVDDSACHTYKGKRTARVEPMWQEGGTIYVYLCYGMHHLLNIVSEKEGVPEAVLIRAVEGAEGPAKTTKLLGIEKSFNGQSIVNNPKICIMDDEERYKYAKKERVGIGYALEKDQKALLRFVIEN
ncbi:MAG: DNA-3-methyladenine glycosylase [Clostridia bacterium]|nr:DNA-3-methyladenine glycosylase [Clostridia bacterium]